MIHLERSTDAETLAVYTALTVKMEDGTTLKTRSQDELDDAIVFFTDPEKFNNEEKLTKDSFDFKVYKDRGLADVLARDFFHKCAYCESRFGHVMPDDVEHFRPKSEIKCDAGNLRPGYYWLAGDWKNLLVSCRDCNAPRAHREQGQTKRVSVGKGTQFPLSDESKRVRSHDDDVALEEDVRLLLHPCIDEPEEHLTFDERGLVHPAMLQGGPSEKGKASIDVYALQRKLLVEERLTEINALRTGLMHLQSYVRNHNNLAAMPNDTTQLRLENAVDIKRSLLAIADLMLPNTEFVGAKRSYIKAAHRRGDFAMLAEFGIDVERFTKLSR